MTTRVIFVAFWLLLAPALAIAQNRAWTPEFSAATGIGHVFRWDDQAFGDEPNVGGAVILVHRSGFALEVEADRTIGLEPKPAPCGVVRVACVGNAHDGPRSMTIASMTAHYRFKGKRVQPYLLGGIGIMWSRSLHSLTQIQGTIAIISESESSDRGFGPDLGAGLRILIGHRLAVSPELRWLDAPWTSRQNLAVTRLLLRVAYLP
jgi:hypothetical protein